MPSARRRFRPAPPFDEKELAGLAQSIRENGLLQPISVRKVEGGYELVAGERRLRACKLARMETIIRPSSVTAATSGLRRWVCWKTSSGKT